MASFHWLADSKSAERNGVLSSSSSQQAGRSRYFLVSSAPGSSSLHHSPTFPAAATTSPKHQLDSVDLGKDCSLPGTRPYARSHKISSISTKVSAPNSLPSCPIASLLLQERSAEHFSFTTIVFLAQGRANRALPSTTHLTSSDQDLRILH